MYCSLFSLYVFITCHDRLVIGAHVLRENLTSWIILIKAYKIKVVLTIWGLTYISFLGCKKIFTSCNEIPFIMWIVRILLYHYSYVFHNDVLFHFIKTKLIKKMSKFKQLCFSNMSISEVNMHVQIHLYKQIFDIWQVCI